MQKTFVNDIRNYILNKFTYLNNSEKVFYGEYSYLITTMRA